MQTPGTAVAAWPRAVGQARSCAECTELGKQQWSCLAGAANEVSQQRKARNTLQARVQQSEHPMESRLQGGAGEERHQSAQPPWSHTAVNKVWRFSIARSYCLPRFMLGGGWGFLSFRGFSGFSIQPSCFPYEWGLDEEILPWAYKWRSWKLLGKSFLQKSSWSLGCFNFQLVVVFYYCFCCCCCWERGFVCFSVRNNLKKCEIDLKSEIVFPHFCTSTFFSSSGNP